MADFSDEYICPACQRQGRPISDDASSEEYRRGWHVTCPACGFAVSGPKKATVLQAVAVLAEHNARAAKLVDHAATEAADRGRSIIVDRGPLAPMVIPLPSADETLSREAVRDVLAAVLEALDPQVNGANIATKLVFEAWMSGMNIAHRWA